jgi:transcriptional regulator with XRE-family HTH domain
MAEKTPSSASCKSTQLQQLGERLALARKRRGLTQAELSERMQTTPRTLYRLERGDPGVGLGVLVRVLGVLELDRELDSLVADDAVGQWAMQGRTPRRVRGKRRVTGLTRPQ